MAAVDVEKVELRLGADAFGDDAQPQAARQRDDRLGDRGVAGIGLEVGDERDVDLERVDREVLQVRQARVAGAEIVDRHRKALLAQLLQHLADGVEIVQQARLGDLELDPRRLAARVAHDLGDALRQIVAIELPSGQVHRHRQRHAGFAPRDALFGRGAQHPVAEDVDQARFLGQRNEDLWRDVAVLRRRASAAAPRHR